jgi:hypothetical protein
MDEVARRKKVCTPVFYSKYLPAELLPNHFGASALPHLCGPLC